MFSLNNIKILFTVFFVLKQTDCLFEVQLTLGTALVPNDRKFINLDRIRVKKFNHSEFYLIGEAEVFVELSNDFQVYTTDKIYENIQP